jgi:hypothetical protein
MDSEGAMVKKYNLYLWLWFLVPLLLITAMLVVWGEEGPWSVLSCDEIYSIYNVVHDTLTVCDQSIEQEYWSKDQALDAAEALNEAHKRRMHPCKSSQFFPCPD